MSNDFSTSQSGAPIASNEHSLTTGPDGVTALHDHVLVEKLASFNRERVPERNPQRSELLHAHRHRPEIGRSASSSSRSASGNSVR